MKKAHSDKEIIEAAASKDKNSVPVKDGQIDIVVDLDDKHGVTHSYVVTYKKENKAWLPFQVTELSSL